MALINEIEAMRKEIRTDAYPMSVGEMISLYQSGELDIHPEFQRFFRWSPEQKSNLIESILLGIPIPAVFVSQRAVDSVWDVVDGLQRLSTIFEFLGILKDEDGKALPPLVLERTKYLPSLQSITWDAQHGSNALPAELKILFKRSKLQVSILLRESDDFAKFELFQRLNRGGAQLSDQEMRNCILVSVDKSAFLRLKDLVTDAGFQGTLSLTDQAIEQQYDFELVLRFLLLSTMNTGDFPSAFDVADLLTEKMVQSAKANTLVSDDQVKRFRGVFASISVALGDDAFRRRNPGTLNPSGGFSLAVFETIACGLGYSFPRLPTSADFHPIIAEIWADQRFRDYSKSGVRASSRLPKLLPLGREIMAKYAKDAV